MPPIPALFFDWIVSRRGNVVFKASVARNHRYPTLNDRYYQPGGNPDLRPEHGFTCDGGVSFAAGGRGEGLLAAGRSNALRLAYRRLDSLGAGAARLLDATQRPQGAQLRRRNTARRLGAPRKRLAAAARHAFRMDAFDQLRRTCQRRRRLLRQTTGLRPRVRRGRHGDARLAALDARLQVELLQRTLHHHEQRHVAANRAGSSPTS